MWKWLWNADLLSVIPNVDGVSKNDENVSIGVEKILNAESNGLVVDGKNELPNDDSVFWRFFDVLVGFARKELNENAEWAFDLVVVELATVQIGSLTIEPVDGSDVWDNGGLDDDEDEKPNIAAGDWLESRRRSSFIRVENDGRTRSECRTWSPPFRSIDSEPKLPLSEFAVEPNSVPFDNIPNSDDVSSWNIFVSLSNRLSFSINWALDRAFIKLYIDASSDEFIIQDASKDIPHKTVL